jgi:hypothetical protein
MFKRTRTRTRTRTKDKTRSRPPASKVTHLYHGIEIAMGSNPCEVAQTGAGKRYLSDEAPLLPLDGCGDPSGCECRYKHFVDRRTDARRDSDSGMPQRTHKDEKRGQAGRRITDD